MKLSITATKAIEVYGGVSLWQQSKYIEAIVSVKGLAFTLKQRPYYDRVKIVMDIDRPFSKLITIGKNASVTSVLDGRNVWLEDAGGSIIAERKNAHTYFPNGRRLIYWDDMDMAYFANYALWNYFTLPKLLMNSAIEWKEEKAGLLKAIFPESIPTHCREQEFYFDEFSGKLMQHNYTANVISKFAKAANVVTAHHNVNGVLYPSARKVTPMLASGKASKFPVMIDILVHQYRLVKSTSALHSSTQHFSSVQLLQQQHTNQYKYNTY